MKNLRIALFLAFLSAVSSSLPTIRAVAATQMIPFRAEIWADNWFALYVNGKKVGEDSVPFATEKSFNSEIIEFKATYPLTVAIMARDFIENESGLEYIGAPNQQIGDGGIIAQIRDESRGEIVGSTNSKWKVKVIQRAPLNPECVKAVNPLRDCKVSALKAPLRWYAKTFEDAAWLRASEYSEAEVGVKGGFLEIPWSSNARLIWSGDLELDNTLLIRGTILAPKSTSVIEQPFTLESPNFTNGGILPIANTCDGAGISPALNFAGVPLSAKSITVIMDTVPGPLRPGEVDIGNHFYLTIFNIPPNIKSIPAGSTSIGTLGANFQGKKLGYTPPCSQGSGLKTYTITAYALTETLSISPNLATQANLLREMSGKIIATSVLQAKYQRG